VGLGLSQQECEGKSKGTIGKVFEGAAEGATKKLKKVALLEG